MAKKSIAMRHFFTFERLYFLIITAVLVECPDYPIEIDQIVVIHMYKKPNDCV